MGKGFYINPPAGLPSMIWGGLIPSFPPLSPWLQKTSSVYPVLRTSQWWNSGYHEKQAGPNVVVCAWKPNNWKDSGKGINHYGNQLSLHWQNISQAPSPNKANQKKKNVYIFIHIFIHVFFIMFGRLNIIMMSVHNKVIYKCNVTT